MRTCLHCGSWLLLVPSYPCQYSSALFLCDNINEYMNSKEALKIASLIKRQSYLENLEQLQLICLKLNIDIDFDYVYFIEEAEQLSIASIHGISIDEKNLYILLKNNQLHSISLKTKEHFIFDLNKSSFKIKLKSFLNKIIINH